MGKLSYGILSAEFQGRSIESEISLRHLLLFIPVSFISDHNFLGIFIPYWVSTDNIFVPIIAHGHVNVVGREHIYRAILHGRNLLCVGEADVLNSKSLSCKRCLLDELVLLR